MEARSCRVWERKKCGEKLKEGWEKVRRTVGSNKHKFLQKSMDQLYSQLLCSSILAHSLEKCEVLFISYFWNSSRSHGTPAPPREARRCWCLNFVNTIVRDTSNSLLLSENPGRETSLRYFCYRIFQRTCDTLTLQRSFQWDSYLLTHFSCRPTPQYIQYLIRNLHFFNIANVSQIPQRNFFPPNSSMVIELMQ